MRFRPINFRLRLVYKPPVSSNVTKPLMRDALLPSDEKDAMTPTPVPCVDSIICHEVASLTSCTLDELTQRLQTYSWAQVFEAVDRLSRQGTLKLTRTGRFGYALSVGSAPPRLRLLQGRGSQELVQQNS